jgi:hypothetical protein
MTAFGLELIGADASTTLASAKENSYSFTISPLTHDRDFVPGVTIAPSSINLSIDGIPASSFIDTDDPSWHIGKLSSTVSGISSLDPVTRLKAELMLKQECQCIYT